MKILKLICSWFTLFPEHDKKDYDDQYRKFINYPIVDHAHPDIQSFYYDIKSSEIDNLITKCFNIGFKTLTNNNSYIIGHLVDGTKFAFYSGNYWHNWMSSGQVGDIYWDETGSHNIYFTQMINPTKRLVGFPSKEIQMQLRNYFLALDYEFFIEAFDQEISKIKLYNDSSTKTYDCVRTNRDLKISSLLRPNIAITGINHQK